MKVIVYTNPNMGSNWLTTKLCHVPGLIKYYKKNPFGIFYEEPFIVDSYGYLIKTITIYENGQVIYDLTNQSQIQEELTSQGIDRLRKYLKKLGWRCSESISYEEEVEDLTYVIQQVVENLPRVDSSAVFTDDVVSINDYTEEDIFHSQLSGKHFS